MTISYLNTTVSLFSLLFTLTTQNLYASDDEKETGYDQEQHDNLRHTGDILPPEILGHVFSFTSVQAGARSHLVCHHWNETL